MLVDLPAAADARLSYGVPQKFAAAFEQRAPFRAAVGIFSLRTFQPLAGVSMGQFHG